jgi:hypothetical protein
MNTLNARDESEDKAPETEKSREDKSQKPSNNFILSSKIIILEDDGDID